MKLLTVQLSPFSCYFIPFKAKYSPLNPVLEIGRRKGKSLREMRRLAVDRGRWKEFVEAPLTL
jgi:hypothetical protein